MRVVSELNMTAKREKVQVDPVAAISISVAGFRRCQSAQRTVSDALGDDFSQSRLFGLDQAFSVTNRIEISRRIFTIRITGQFEFLNAAGIFLLRFLDGFKVLGESFAHRPGASKVR